MISGDIRGGAVARGGGGAVAKGGGGEAVHSPHACTEVENS
jgi:hypothetical protein